MCGSSWLLGFLGLGYQELIIAIVLIPLVGLCWFLSSTLGAIPQQYRTMEPGWVWLMLIPFFGIAWIFFVFSRISRSYRTFFFVHARYDVGDCGERIGFWYCICVAFGIVPFVAVIAWPVSLILLIAYLVKIGKLKRQAQVLAAQGDGRSGYGGYTPPKPY